MLIQAEVLMDLSDFRRMSERAQNLQPAMEGPVDRLVTAFLVAQFASEGEAGGEKWAPLAASTLKGRRAPGHGKGGIGRDTNRMWSSLVKSPSPEGVVSAGPDYYERWTDVPYAKFFQEGRTHQPARPIFPETLPLSLVRQIEDTLSWYVAFGRLEVSDAAPAIIGIGTS